jgi:glycosyltransferase involved in cell wall biosynthesis
MHIAHFTNTYHPTISGVVRSVSSYREALSQLGHNVFVFTQDAGDYVDTEPFVFRYLSLNIGLPNEFPATIPISPFMDRLMPTLKMDVIHAHHPVLLGQIAAGKAEELNLPLVFTFHTRYREYSHYLPIPQEVVQDFIKGAIDLWIQDYIEKCDSIIVPSEGMHQVLVENYQIDAPITVLPTGVDLQPYEEADGGPIRQQEGWANQFIIISVGRLAPEKNWGMLLDAFAKVNQAHPQTRLVLLGDGPDRRKLQRQAKKMGIADQVEFKGKVSFEDVPAYLKAADLFAFASNTETQGLVTLEAMAAGLPVVAVDAVGTRDTVVPERDGLLTDMNADALAAAIGRMVGEEETLAHFHEAAIKRAAELDIVTQAAKLTDIYETAIEIKRSKLAAA